MNAPATPPPKKPHDYFRWGYWFLFLLVVPVIAILIANKPSQVSLPVFKAGVPPYHIITSSDISMKQVDMDTVVTGTLRTIQDLVGHYTLVPVIAHQPVLANQISPQPEPLDLISNTLATAIPANSVTTFGGSLHAGDVVSLAVVPLSDTTSSISPPTILFNTLLVLDVKSSGNQSVIVLAIPANQWIEYLTKTHNMTIVLARQVT
jgi:Flp pilus assembly protein CpaB